MAEGRSLKPTVEASEDGEREELERREVEYVGDRRMPPIVWKSSMSVAFQLRATDRPNVLGNAQCDAAWIKSGTTARERMKKFSRRRLWEGIGPLSTVLMKWSSSGAFARAQMRSARVIDLRGLRRNVDGGR